MLLETKFDIGSEVFFLMDEKIVQGIVLHIEIHIWKEKEEHDPKNETYRIGYEDLGEKKEPKTVHITGNQLFKSVDEIVEYLKKNVRYIPGSEAEILNKYGQA